MVCEWVDEAFAGAVGAVRVGLVRGPGEFGAVGAAAASSLEVLFEFVEALVEVHRLVGWSAWRSSRRVVSSSSSA